MESFYLLHYEYVPNMVELRVPHREAHLALVDRYHADGRLAIAGAYGDPVHGGLLAFQTAEDAKAFAAEDPYGAAELVASSKVEPWTVLVR